VWSSAVPALPSRSNVSAIIPCLEEEQATGPCVCAVLSHLREVIVVDGGSRPHSSTGGRGWRQGDRRTAAGLRTSPFVGLSRYSTHDHNRSLRRRRWQRLHNTEAASCIIANFDVGDVASSGKTTRLHLCCNRSAAENVTASIRTTIARLSEMPLLGKATDEGWCSRYRRVRVPLSDSTASAAVFVLRILHGRQS
jgi:hypothetical protein